MYNVSRTNPGGKSTNTLRLSRPKLAHISLLLRSNSGAMPLADKAYKIFVGSDRTLEGSTDADGLVLHKNVPPGDYEMELEGLEERMFVPTTPAHIERRLTRVPGYFLFEDQEGGDAEDPKEEDEDEDTNPLNEPDEEDDDGWELLETFEDNGDDVNDG